MMVKTIYARRYNRARGARLPGELGYETPCPLISFSDRMTIPT